ncbi:MAG: hypothetical protein JO235_18505 [Chroococcidiopsidaceae cyanobacterium CP_BM_RX_35]|nr:hypothetical protein [Chroococcidiopsidaceae cyanobacterium CP_BM_RX_35]
MSPKNVDAYELSEELSAEDLECVVGGQGHHKPIKTKLHSMGSGLVNHTPVIPTPTPVLPMPFNAGHHF